MSGVFPTTLLSMNIGTIPRNVRYISHSRYTWNCQVLKCTCSRYGWNNRGSLVALWPVHTMPQIPCSVWWVSPLWFWAFHFKVHWLLLAVLSLPAYWCEQWWCSASDPWHNSFLHEQLRKSTCLVCMHHFWVWQLEISSGSHSCNLSIYHRWCVGSFESCNTLSAALQNWPAWTHYSRHLCWTVKQSAVRLSTSTISTDTVNHVNMKSSAQNIAEWCGSKCMQSCSQTVTKTAIVLLHWGIWRPDYWSLIPRPHSRLRWGGGGVSQCHWHLFNQISWLGPTMGKSKWMMMQRAWVHVVLRK